MNNIFTFNGYQGSIELSLEDEVLHGKILCINDLVTYEAETLNELKKAFEEAVNDYLQTCKELNRSPDKAMSGTFNVRIGSELHKKLFVSACQAGQSLNDFVKNAIEEKLADKQTLHFNFFVQRDVSERTKNYTLTHQSGRWIQNITDVKVAH